LWMSLAKNDTEIQKKKKRLAETRAIFQLKN
jgi:hypothetical protein